MLARALGRAAPSSGAGARWTVAIVGLARTALLLGRLGAGACVLAAKTIAPTSFAAILVSTALELYRSSSANKL